AKAVATGGHRLRATFHGKEGVDLVARESPRAADGQQTPEIVFAQPCGGNLRSNDGTAWIERSRTERRRRCEGRSGLSRRRSPVRVPRSRSSTCKSTSLVAKLGVSDGRLLRSRIDPACCPPITMERTRPPSRSC